MGEEYEYSRRVSFTENRENVRCGMMIKNLNGREIGGLVSNPEGEGISVLSGEVLEVRLRFVARLAPRTYFGNAGVVGPESGDEVNLHRILNATMFRVEGVRKNRVTGPVEISKGGLCEIVRRT